MEQFEIKQVPKPSHRMNTDIEKLLSMANDLELKVERNDFSRDRDRILFSRAFRRLEHKAQVYSHEKGDHYRTRLTHTLEVSQIARSLAKNFSLNEELTEAIALGHDIGHTPFGHQGERTLDLIMNGDDNLTKKIQIPMNYGGFKHNYNSIKVLDIIETKYEKYKGLNLTWQVMEGILKHTKIKRHKKDQCKDCGKCWNINRFIKDKSLIEKLHLEYSFSVTLEGQVVAIADEIAQRQHDLDDGLRDISLKLKIDDVCSEINKFIKKIVGEYNSTSSKVLNPQEENKSVNDILIIERLQAKLIRIEKSKDSFFKRNSLVRDVIEYFILDATNQSLCNIKNLKSDDCEEREGNYIFNKNIIRLSEVGRKLNDQIEQYINNQIVNSFDVNRFDGKAIFVIRQLFKAFYTNPRQMPEYMLRRLEEKINDNSYIYKLAIRDESLNKDIEFGKINFKMSKREYIDKLLNTLKLEITIDDLNTPEKFDGDKYINREVGKYIKYDVLKDEELININKMDIDEIIKSGDKSLRFIKCLLENNYAFLSTICEYISGMTDNFANKEYTELYLT